MQGAIFVNNLAEIPDNILKENKTVIVFESYFQNNDSYSCIRLFKKIFKLDYIFIGSDSTLLERLQEYGRVYYANVRTIDFATIQGAYFDDKSLESKSDSIYNKEIVTLAEKIVSQPDGYDAKFCKLT